MLGLNRDKNRRFSFLCAANLRTKKKEKHRNLFKFWIETGFEKYEAKTSLIPRQCYNFRVFFKGYGGIEPHI
jgi:hypothetical protein